jgi:hypothetical protein
MTPLFIDNKWIVEQFFHFDGWEKTNHETMKK